MNRFTANASNFDELIELLQTARENSYNDPVFVMSNGSQVHLIHAEYKAEFEADGYWVASIYENGLRAEI